MDIRNDIKYILSKEGITLTKMAELLSKKTGKHYTVNGLSGKLLRESITLKETLEIFEIIGYKLIPTPKNKN